MARPSLGVVAAGHPVSAAAGADVLRRGGNAVDAALGCMFASFVCEPLLTGLGAGGYMLVAAPQGAPTLLDFFVEAPGRGAGAGQRGELVPITVSFGDAAQVFNIGAASVGTYGVPAGVCEAAARFGRMTVAELVAPVAALARDGVALTAEQAHLVELLVDVVTATPEGRALFAPQGRLVRAGERLYQPELADALERLGAEGVAPFYTGEVARAIAEWVAARGGILTPADLAAYAVIDRQPTRAVYRGSEVLTNPPPSAGGILLAHALALLDAQPAPPSIGQLVAAMEHAQAERTPEVLEGLADPSFVERFLAGPPPSSSGGRAPSAGGPPGPSGGGLGSTTHVAVLDREGWACSVTCSNGSSSGVIVPGTGVHLNNMLGEQDLNPLGFHRHPPGRRLPSMMAPTMVLRDGMPELALGSAGSNRIRSAILQTISRVIDEGMRAREAVEAPRAHYEDGVVYTEPGIEVRALEAEGRTIAAFHERNLFFGGVQAVQRDRAGGFWGAGDPRRGGAALVVD